MPTKSTINVKSHRAPGLTGEVKDLVLVCGVGALCGSQLAPFSLLKMATHGGFVRVTDTTIFSAGDTMNVPSEFCCMMFSHLAPHTTRKSEPPCPKLFDRVSTTSQLHRPLSSLNTPHDPT